MSDKHVSAAGQPEELKLAGLLAEFDNVDDLVHACAKVRDAGYERWDAHSPFPVHGIDEAMGIKQTILPWLVLGGGITGLTVALLLQWWTNAVDYPFIVSGKPYFSLPANIPVCFELTVLLSALTAFFSVLALNLLPQFYHPLFRNERFLRFSDDRFFIAIDEKDAKFDRQRTAALLRGLGGVLACEEVMDSKAPVTIPKGFIYAGIAAMVFSWIPLLIIGKARYTKSNKPPIHLIWDMDWQKKYKSQNVSPLFADGRAMRPQVAETVAIGQFYEDDQVPYYEGRVLDPTTVANPNGWVEQVPVPASEIAWRIDRGQQRFNIYCAPCHGASGNGGGTVALRAAELQDAGNAEGWVPPLPLHSDDLRARPVGDIFNTITHGIRTMPAYGSRIPVDDRWNIILYVRALQRSQWATKADVPQQDLPRVEQLLGTR